MQQTRILHEEEILEAIDQLRRRKARPDADRICNYLLRKFSVDARDTISDLHRLIESEKVIQVDYKGNTSYRNASKWSRLQLYKNRPEGFVKEKLHSAMVAGAVAELVVEEPDYLDQGVPGYRLVEQLLDGISNPTSRRMVEDFLNKEVTSGNLIRLFNGNYSLVATSDMMMITSTDNNTTKDNGTKEASQHVSSTTGSLYDFEESRSSDTLKSYDKEEAKESKKRSSKAERKQRLLVRTDDQVDIEIKFEDYGKEKKEERLCEEVEDDDAGRSSTNPSPTPSNNANVGGFRSARRKRAKKVFDPSDNNLVKRKRGRQPGTHNNPVVSSKVSSVSPQESQEAKSQPFRRCSLCSKEKQERLVACRDCTVRAHPSCIYSPDEMINKIGTSWQCERCKSCTICCETSDVGPLATCFVCDEAYHYYCHSPRITILKSNSKWQCIECTQKQMMINGRPETPTNTQTLPPVLSPQVSPSRATSDVLEDDNGTDAIDPNIPDASDWTSEQVYQYFLRLFPKEAEIFRQQDIDGHSLLLMKRADVLSGLDLLLGPALKIYRHVLRLQERRDDPKLYWL